MKFSKDQKQMVKIMAYGIPGYVISCTFFRWLFTKEFSWSDVLVAGVAGIALGIVGILFVIGSSIPKK